MNLDAISRPLTAEEVEFRVQSINRGGYATILAYKNARVDMQRLDEAFGVLGWQRRHTNGNANCVISLWNPDTGEWVSKEDTGTESQADSAKGLASDSFKRAAFNIGIGRELYAYPNISIKLLDNEWEMNGDRARQTWGLKLKEWQWYIEHDDGGHVSFIAARDNNEKVRFQWGERAP